MEWGTLVLRRLVGPVISRTIPAIRTARARLIRGRCFNPARGKTYILLPDGVDYESASQIGAMLESLWYAAERDWELVRTGAGEPLRENFTHANLVCLGGPDQNSLVREILRDHPDLLQSVRYHDGAAGPEFRWLDQAFRPGAESDFALVAIKRNPFTSDPRRTLVLIMGLGDAGTLAGATFYASARHARERREVQRAAGTLRGTLEVLLHVGHSAGRGESLRVRPARRTDGTPPDVPVLPPAKPDRALPPGRTSLARIYDSLEQHRRRVVLSDLRFTLTVTRDFSLQMEEEVTIGAERQDVVVFTKKLRGTPLGFDEEIGFAAEVVDGDDDIGELPAEVLQGERRFLLFPLPALIAGGPPRRIRISAVWPRACHTLGQPGGEDLNSVEVSEHAGPNVEAVTVTIRFDAPDAAFQVFERFPLDKVVSANALENGARTRRRTYGIHAPYEVRLADVPPGTAFEFRIVRVPQPEPRRA